MHSLKRKFSQIESLDSEKSIHKYIALELNQETTQDQQQDLITVFKELKKEFELLNICFNKIDNQKKEFKKLSDKFFYLTQLGNYIIKKNNIDLDLDLDHGVNQEILEIMGNTYPYIENIQKIFIN